MRDAFALKEVDRDEGLSRGAVRCGRQFDGHAPCFPKSAGWRPDLGPCKVGQGGGEGARRRREA